VISRKNLSIYNILIVSTKNLFDVKRLFAKSFGEFVRTIPASRHNSHYIGFIKTTLGEAGEKTKVDLIKVSVRDLGFVSFDEARYADLLPRARGMNLGLCQIESITKLCLQDLEQADEQYLVAMEPVESDKHADHLCILRIFYKDRVLWLGTASFTPNAVWSMESTLIFQAL